MNFDYLKRLVTDKLFKSADFVMRKQYIKLAESVKTNGGQVSHVTYSTLSSLLAFLSSFCFVQFSFKYQTQQLNFTFLVFVITARFFYFIFYILFTYFII
jgi:hypothetical protein